MFTLSVLLADKCRRKDSENWSKHSRRARIVGTRKADDDYDDDNDFALI